MDGFNLFNWFIYDQQPGSVLECKLCNQCLLTLFFIRAIISLSYTVSSMCLNAVFVDEIGVYDLSRMFR